MADLTNILGGHFTPPKEVLSSSPESQLRDCMRDVGIEAPDTLYMDGKIHRFKTNLKGSGG